jgi:hypothetical protein
MLLFVIHTLHLSTGRFHYATVLMFNESEYSVKQDSPDQFLLEGENKIYYSPLEAWNRYILPLRLKYLPSFLVYTYNSNVTCYILQNPVSIFYFYHQQLYRQSFTVLTKDRQLTVEAQTTFTWSSVYFKKILTCFWFIVCLQDTWNKDRY